MEREQADRSEGIRATESKRLYRRPEIRRLGSVRELTLTGGSNPTFDGLPGSTGTKTS